MAWKIRIGLASGAGGGRKWAPNGSCLDQSLIAAGWTALADDFVEEDGGGGGDVEGVGLSKHGDADQVVGLRHPGAAESVLFGADDDGDGLGHVYVGVVFRGVGGGGDGADAAGAEPGDGVVGGGFGDGDGEERADGGADDVGVVDVGAAVADDEGVGAGGIGSAQHGAEIAGFFDVLADDEKRIGGQLQVIQGAAGLWAEGEKSFRPVTVGDFAEDRFGALEQGDVLFGAAGDQTGFVLALIEGGAEKEAVDGNPVVEGALDFAIAFDDEESGFVAVGALAQLDDVLDAGVLEAGDELG